MPPLPMYPNVPSGYPDINYSNGYGNDSSSVYAGQYSQGQARPTSNGYGQGADYVTPEQWAQALQQAQALVNAKAGGATPFERQVQQQKIDDLKRGYQNSLKIAQLQADTSRYGYDQTRQTALDQLKQADRQFALNHDLAVRNADISEAQLIAQQRSQPNRLFQTMDLEQALGSIRNGSSGRATTMPMSTRVAALNGLSTDYQGNPYLTGGGGGGGQQAPSSSQGTDPRLTAAGAVMKALPPSATAGLDPTGVAALNAVYHLYSAPQTARPGSMESLSPTQRATLQSGGERVQQYTGISPDDFAAQYRRQAPGQSSVRYAA